MIDVVVFPTPPFDAVDVDVSIAGDDDGVDDDADSDMCDDGRDDEGPPISDPSYMTFLENPDISNVQPQARLDVLVSGSAAAIRRRHRCSRSHRAG